MGSHISTESISEQLDPTFFERALRLLKNLKPSEFDSKYEIVKEDMTFFSQYLNGNQYEKFVRSFIGCAFLKDSSKYDDFERSIRIAFSLLEETELTAAEHGMFFLVLALWMRDARERGHPIKFNTNRNVSFSANDISAEMWYFFIAADDRTKEYRELYQ